VLISPDARNMNEMLSARLFGNSRDAHSALDVDGIE
jgi:hypothetical protein